MEENSTPRLILLVTVGLMILFVIGSFFFSNMSPEPGTHLNTQNQPTLGNPEASLQVVAFEDPKSFASKSYHTNVFPKLKKDYIDNNQIEYSTILISSIPHSIPISEALLCVYYQDEKTSSSELFYEYLNTIYENQPVETIDWATTDTLEKIAKEANPKINFTKMRSCIERHVYHTQVMRNTEYASKVMDGNLKTPGIYVNGIKAPSNTYEDISLLIEKFLIAKKIKKE